MLSQSVSFNIPNLLEFFTSKFVLSLLILVLLIASTGCVSLKPITQTNLSQSWFDEEEVVKAGIPFDQIPNLNKKKVFLTVHTTIPDDDKIIHDIKLDQYEGKVLSNPISIVGGIRKAVEERIRLRLKKNTEIVFVESAEDADFKVDVNILKAGLDVLKSKGEHDNRNMSDIYLNQSLKGVSFLSIQTSVNGKNASYYNTIDFEEKMEFGFSSEFPTTVVKWTWYGNAFLGDRKLCTYAYSVRKKEIYGIIIVIDTYEGVLKLIVYSPSGQETEVSIDKQEWTLNHRPGVLMPLIYDKAMTMAAFGDLQKLGEEIKKTDDQRLQNFAKYNYVYTTGSGLLIVLIHDYINHLENLLR